ncbi:MAG: M16 family metallopeptidase [Bacteroidota bacterium]
MSVNRLSTVFWAGLTGLMLLISGCAPTQQTQKDSSDAPLEIHKRYDELDFPELGEFAKPEITTFTTDNGVEFYLVEDHELPLVDLRVLVRTGGVLVPNQKAGLTSILGSAMRSGGTEQHPSDQLNEMLEDRAARMETYAGFTSAGASMNVLKDDFDALLPVFIDLLENPTFPEDKIELAKKQVKTSISRRNDNPQQIAFREFERLIYGEDSKYGRLTEYSTVDNITRDDLMNFHKEHFNGENMMVAVIGDFDTEEMKAKLSEQFSTLPEGDETKLEFPEVNYDFEQTINLIDKPDVNQSVVLMGHVGGMRDNPDYAALQVMNNVLSGGFSGRLMQKVRTDMGLAYAVFGSYGSNSFYPGQFYTGVMTKSTTTAEAIDAIIAEVKLLQNEPITEKELSDTKDRILNSVVFEYDSKEKVLNEHVSNIYRGMDPNTFDQYIENVKKVTIADVQRVAKEYLQPEQMQMLVVGNKEEIGDQLNKYGQVNEIDITIPEPGAGSDVDMGDMAKGEELLGNMKQAIASNPQEIKTLTTSGSQTVSTPMGEQTMDSETTIKFEEDYLSQSVNTPNGKITFELEGNSGKMVMMGQERPLPPARIKQMKANVNRSYISIARTADKIDAGFVGMETFEGEEYAKLVLDMDKTVTMLVDTETNLPRLMRYQRFDAQSGKQVQVEEQYTDWQKVDGIQYAYTTLTYQDGQEAGKSSVDEVKVNE